MARRGKARQGLARLAMLWHGMAWDWWGCYGTPTVMYGVWT
jgi:hypothetical protein